MKNIILTKLFILCGCFGMLWIYAPNFIVKAQTCNSQNSPAVVESGFPRGVEVKVYIPTNPPTSNGFSQAQVNALQTAFNNWGNSENTNNSRLTFTIVNTQPAAGTYQWLIGHEPPTTTLGSRAETGTVTTDNQGNAQQVVTVIDPRVTTAQALIDVMAHEIGHGMGLNDCAACLTSDSVMSVGNKRRWDDWNGSSGRPSSPTPCDNKRLQQANYPYCNPPVNTETCNWNSTTCLCINDNNGGGSGPFYPEPGSYCTEYYWVEYLSWDGGETWEINPNFIPEYAGCFY